MQMKVGASITQKSDSLLLGKYKDSLRNSSLGRLDRMSSTSESEDESV